MTATVLQKFGLMRMSSRDPHEQHRVASSLEIFFDLVFVIAVSQASQNLHHGVVEGHAAATVLAYAMIFFAIWWAWMNFTCFASAFDSDDWLYRVMTIVQMGGVLVPVWAERARSTPWHPHHIAEHYSLFVLILLGESLLASANAIIDAVNTGEHVEGVVGLAAAGLVLTAGVWWM